jgi:hypothetical protein
MPTKKKKESSKDDEIITTITQRWETGTKFLKTYLDNFTRYYKIYRAYVNDDKLPTSHKCFNPYVFSAIEVATSKAVANKPKGTFAPKGKEDNQETENHNLVFDYYYSNDEEQMFLKTASTFKKGLIYGTAVGEVIWRFETGFRDGKKTVVCNRPGYRLLNLENGDFVFDSEAENIDSAKWFIKREQWTKKDVEDLKESPFASQFKDLDKLIDAYDQSSFDSNSYKTEKLSVSGASGVNDTTITKVEVLHEYCNGYIRTLVGKKYLVRDIPNPFLFNHPFVSVIDHIVPSELLGMGEVEPTERLQHTLNTIENQRRDNVALVLNKVWLSGKNGFDDEDEVVTSPGAIFRVNDINQVREMEISDVTSSSYTEADSIKNDIQNTLSISNFSKGTDEQDTANKSGVAIARLQSAADARIQTKMQLFEEMFLKQLAKKWLKLISQYGDPKISVRITDGNQNQWKDVPREDVAGEYDYKVEAGSMQHTDKTVARQEFNEFVDRLVALADRKGQAIAQQQPQPQIDPQTGKPLPTPPPPPRTIDYDKLAETMAEKYGIKNFKEIWIQEETQQQGQEGQPQEERLPSVEMEERQREEMLPPVDMPDLPEPPQQETTQEKLPPIDDIINQQI